MIKCDKGNVSIEGTRPLVLAELSTLVHSLHHGVFTGDQGLPAEVSRKLILEAVEDGFKTEEEAKQKAIGMTKELLSEVLNSLQKILNGKDDE